MRFILLYKYGFFQKKSERIDVKHCQTTEDLMDYIQKKVGKGTDYMLRCRCDKNSYRIVRGWPISIYQLRDGSQLELEVIEREETESKSKYANNKYLMNILGDQKKQLNKIQQQDEQQQEEEGQQTAFNVRKYLDEELQKILKWVQKGKWQAIAKILDELPQNASQQDVQEIQKSKQHMLNDLGQGGWGAIHYAIFCNKPQILNQLLTRKVDVNKCTTDGWLPLQLAVNRKNQDILRILLFQPSLHINQTTIKGSSLHVACRSGSIEVTKALLNAGADWKVLDEKGKNCIEACTNDDCMRAIKQFDEDKDKQTGRISKVDQLRQIAILRGTVLKAKTVFLALSEKYLVLDPYQGTLIRYDDQSGYPKRPKETIPLSEIVPQGVRIITNKTWQMKKDLTYFQVMFSKKFLFATKHEMIAVKWVNGIQEAVKYQLSISRMSISTEIKEQLKTTFDLNDITGQVIEVPKIKSIDVGRPLAKSGQLIEKKGKTFNVNSPRNSPKTSQGDQQAECMSPRLPRKNGLQTSVASKPSDKQQSFSEDNPPIRLINKSSQQSMNEVSQIGPMDASTLAMFVKEQHEGSSKQQDMKQATKQLTKQLESMMNQKVNFASFEIIQTLGSGAFGKVFLARHARTGINYALKALKKKTLIVKKQLRYAITQAKVLKLANHPFIINLHYAFQTPNYLYLALDYCPGKDLSFHLAKQCTFSEDQTRIYIAQLILAIEHLHSKNILYRDLKPQNILLDADGHIKLADFGLSKDNVEDKSKSFCGSPAYLSPQMLNQKGVGKESDIYGIGCVIYECLVGEPPYYSDDMPTLFENIRQGKLKFPKHVTEDAKSVIAGLLERDPKKRLGCRNIQDLKRHPFFSKIDWKVAASKGLTPPVRQFRDDEEDSDDEIALNKQVPNNKTQPNFTDFDYQDDGRRINRLNDFSFVRTQV